MKKDGQHLLEVKNVVKKFGDFAALNGVSIDVDKGQIVSFLGPSGCGKTTLLRTIGGFYMQNEGDIYLDGKLINKLPPEQRETVMFFQNYALFPHMTVFENVTYGLKINKVPKKEIKERAKDILALTRLTEMEKRLPDQMSGGQQQRVALARALILNPKLLLLDEPLSNLDANLREYMRDEIIKIQERLGLTIIFVTHDQQEAMSIATKIAVMQEGLIKQIGTPFEIYRYPENFYVADFVGDTNFIDATINNIYQDDEAYIDAKKSDVSQKHKKQSKFTKSYFGTSSKSKVKMDLNSEIGNIKVSVIEKDYKIGEKIKAMVRPENINIVVMESLEGEKSKNFFEELKKTKSNLFEGEILKSFYLGEQIRYKIKVNEKIFLVKLYNPKEEEYLVSGTKVYIEIPEEIHVIRLDLVPSKSEEGVSHG